MSDIYWTQGKCTKCKVRHAWPANTVKVSDAVCPSCSTKLKRTTYRVELPTRTWPLGLGVGVAAVPELPVAICR